VVTVLTNESRWRSIDVQPLCKCRQARPLPWRPWRLDFALSNFIGGAKHLGNAAGTRRLLGGVLDNANDRFLRGPSD
jgi:hypothetical protein